MDTNIQADFLSNAAQEERLALEIMNKVDSDAQSVSDTVERFGFANINATREEGSEGREETSKFGIMNRDATDRDAIMNRDAIERASMAGESTTLASGVQVGDTVEKFGFQNLNAIARSSDLGVAAARAAQSTAEGYGVAGIGATKDAEKDVLGAICDSSAGLSAAAREILLSQSGGFRDVLLQSAQNTSALQMSMCADTKDILLQAAGDTASIKSQSASEFKDVLLQAAGNTASIRSDLASDVKDIQMQACEDTDNIKSQAASQFKDLLLQNAAIAKDDAIAAALNAKDAEISRVSNAKDAALAAAVNFERLYGQADRNTASVQATAMDNASKLAAQIAECCCENQKLVIEKTAQTDMLIRQLDEGRVKEALSDAKLEIFALKSRHHENRG
jgi:hypothetical protein